ncbi:unnamed protein product [Phyllotreta striolata]|uniref:Cation-dependent mannose-6-phosphate receptor n=1 Tax=Phyllotreta striolata TaxID=444603 RepID=A0A9N9TWB6_PHYSR|nr:unnamed protein product [Phyllotreta striolata]
MLKIREVLLICSPILLFTNIAAVCVSENPCFCQLNDNQKINISTILEDGQYLNDTQGNITYTYSGCHNIKYPNNLLEAGVLFRSVYYEVKTNNTTSINVNHTVLGKAESIKFATTDNNYLITFLNETDKKAITATIQLLCDNVKQPFLKILNDNNKELLLSSPKVCIITEYHGMNGGSVFLLILFIVASVYLIGGALVLYFIRGARGAEVIPNVEFWKNLPGLVKDGIIFLLSGCRPNFVTTAETYDRI